MCNESSENSGSVWRLPGVSGGILALFGVVSILTSSDMPRFNWLGSMSFM